MVIIPSSATRLNIPVRARTVRNFGAIMANVPNTTINAISTPNTGCLNSESPNLKKKLCNDGFSCMLVFALVSIVLLLFSEILKGFGRPFSVFKPSTESLVQSSLSTWTHHQGKVPVSDYLLEV